MANWYGTARSNYFNVKDPEAFSLWALSRGLQARTGRNNQYSIFPNPMGDGNWPSTYQPEDENAQREEFDLIQELSEHLAVGQIAVIMEVGSEKARYVTGWSEAVNSEGITVSVDISEIYGKAAKKFNVSANSISRAEY